MATLALSQFTAIPRLAGERAALRNVLENNGDIWERRRDDELFKNALAAGPLGFPVYDRILAPRSNAGLDQTIGAFRLLQAMPRGVSRYLPAARRLALDPDLELKSITLVFLAKHGGSEDVKLALTFLCADGLLWRPCCDILARFGGADELVLLEAAVQFRANDSTLESRDHARGCLATLRQRIVDKKVRAAAKAKP